MFSCDPKGNDKWMPNFIVFKSDYVCQIKVTRQEIGLSKTYIIVGLDLIFTLTKQIIINLKN
jgi:hypothetical protein